MTMYDSRIMIIYATLKPCSCVIWTCLLAKTRSEERKTFVPAKKLHPCQIQISRTRWMLEEEIEQGARRWPCSQISEFRKARREFERACGQRLF